MSEFNVERLRIRASGRDRELFEDAVYEIERLRALQFSPSGDNHHNAALCPHCGEPLRKALAEIERLELQAIGRGVAHERIVRDNQKEFQRLQRLMAELRKENIKLKAVVDLPADLEPIRCMASACHCEHFGAATHMVTMPGGQIEAVSIQCANMHVMAGYQCRAMTRSDELAIRAAAEAATP